MAALLLAYMTQAVVETHGWIDTGQMIDALWLAGTTPGQLMLVTVFTGALAGAADGETGLALAAGVLTLWVTFCPCFLWIFAGALTSNGCWSNRGCAVRWGRYRRRWSG